MGTHVATEHKEEKRNPLLTGETIHVYDVNKVGAGASKRWLEKGIADFKVSPMTSIAYGAIYVLVGLVLAYFTWNNPLYLVSMVTGFLLIGPIVAVGFYCMSRRIEEGGKPTFLQGFDAIKFNTISLVSFALILGFLLIAWTRVASLVVALFFGSTTISDDLIATIASNPQTIPFLVTYALVGLFFAGAAFMISLVSVPLITNRKVDVITAIVTSMKAVVKNPSVAISWAFIIATLIFLGFIFGFVGLAITLPIVGHASWHAYRELVSERDVELK